MHTCAGGARSAPVASGADPGGQRLTGYWMRWQLCYTYAVAAWWGGPLGGWCHVRSQACTGVRPSGTEKRGATMARRPHGERPVGCRQEHVCAPINQRRRGARRLRLTRCARDACVSRVQRGVPGGHDACNCVRVVGRPCRCLVHRGVLLLVLCLAHVAVWRRDERGALAHKPSRSSGSVKSSTATLYQ